MGIPNLDNIGYKFFIVFVTCSWTLSVVNSLVICSVTSTNRAWKIPGSYRGRTNPSTTVSRFPSLSLPQLKTSLILLVVNLIKPVFKPKGICERSTDTLN